MSRPAENRPAWPAVPEELSGLRVTVLGLGRFGGGVGAARWLVGRGAKVTVSDRCDAGALADSLAELEDLELMLHLGGHREEDFREADLLVVNPAIPKSQPQLAAAIAAGVPWTTEMNLFLGRCPCRVAGVTGSVGKSTTTAMLGQILAAARGEDRVHVGGNIGRSLLAELEAIGPDDIAVVELSSFMLEDLPQIARSPAVALVTNLRENHLDRHGTMDAYARAKQNIYRFQGPEDVLIVNDDDPEVRRWAADAPGRVQRFSVETGETFELRVPGRHNQANARAAWAAARHLGATIEQARATLGAFAGLEDRLEFVAEISGVRFYNDSKCTTPEGAVVALEAFEAGRAVLIAGGYDKKVRFDALGSAIARRARAVVAIGAVRGQILSAIPAGCGIPCEDAGTDFEAAVRRAAARARPGDAVLLSPACASYDMFANYQQRGRAFKRIVGELNVRP